MSCEVTAVEGLNVNLTEVERIWVEELARRSQAGELTDFWNVRISLNARLPSGFRREDISSTLASDDQPTLLGIFAIDPKSALIRDSERAIKAVRNHVLANPQTQKVPCSAIAEELGVTSPEASKLLRLAQTIGPFFEGWSGTPELPMKVVQVGERTLGTLLSFESVEQALAAAANAHRRFTISRGAVEEGDAQYDPSERFVEVERFLMEGRTMLRERNLFRLERRFDSWAAEVGDWLAQNLSEPVAARWTVLGLEEVRAGDEDNDPAAMHGAIRQRIGWLGDLAEQAEPPQAELDQKFRILRSAPQLARDFSAVTSGLQGADNGAMLFIDIDSFKRFNDEYTEEVVDETILPDVQRLLRKHVQGRGTTYRQGGEEFLLLLPNHTREEAGAFAERLRGAVAGESFSIGANVEKITVSIGVACWPDNGATAADVRGAANRAKKLAKDQGRDRVIVAEVTHGI